MITYMDRVCISSAVPSIQREFGLSMGTMGLVLGSFRWAYAIFQIPGGWLGDRFGPRRALSAIVSWWSVFSSFTALAWSATSLIVVRFLFGVGEAGAFPIATRSLSRWVLPSERGFAQGITHAGSRLGAAMTPFVVALMIARWGWRIPFYCFGSLGIVWSVVWFVYYRNTPAEHKSVNAAELELIRNAIGETRSADSRVPWAKIIGSSQMWLLSMMYFCYAFSLGFYLDWFPKYLNSDRHFALEKMGLFASFPLLAGTLGNASGGWFSDIRARKGNLRRARAEVGVTGFVIAAFTLLGACYASNPYTSVEFSCVAMFGLELTVGVSWAIPLDIGGDFAGSVSAFMNTWGNLGAATATSLFGFLAQAWGWDLPFIAMSALSGVAAILFLRIDASKKLV